MTTPILGPSGVLTLLVAAYEQESEVINHPTATENSIYFPPQFINETVGDYQRNGQFDINNNPVRITVNGVTSFTAIFENVSPPASVLFFIGTHQYKYNSTIVNLTNSSGEGRTSLINMQFSRDLFDSISKVSYGGGFGVFIQVRPPGATNVRLAPQARFTLSTTANLNTYVAPATVQEDSGM